MGQNFNDVIITEARKIPLLKGLVLYGVSQFVIYYYFYGSMAQERNIQL